MLFRSRERQARVILSDSERQIARSFEDAARVYTDNPTALHLRGMNMLYEGLKSNNAVLVLVPAPVLNTMALGDMTGLIALSQTMKKGKDESTETPPE